MALFRLDSTLEPGDWEKLFTPTLINFLYQSNGVIAVLPSRESPHAFRTLLTQWVSRRRFDSRVRVIDYVGEDLGAPYVVNLSTKTGGKGPAKAQAAEKAKEFRKMERAGAAVQGARSKMFVELVAFEIAEVLFGPQTAGRMFFHGIKRIREVGNLCIGLLRPGLACAETVRGMADVELSLERNEGGLILKAIRPVFPSHRVVADLLAGQPHVSLVSAP